MSYTPHTWVNNETITAAKLNNIEEGITEAAQSGGGIGYDAVIRLTHANNSNEDSANNLTPSIVSGTFASLKSKLSNGGVPNILVEYYHPWGITGTLVGFVIYVREDSISLSVAGYFYFKSAFQLIGSLLWDDADTIVWD